MSKLLTFLENNCKLIIENESGSQDILNMDVQKLE